jgi:hypothetical protein
MESGGRGVGERGRGRMGEWESGRAGERECELGAVYNLLSRVITLQPSLNIEVIC